MAKLPAIAAGAFLLVAALVAAIALAGEPEPESEQVEVADESLVPDRVLAVVPPGGAALWFVPGEAREFTAAEGLVLPFDLAVDGYLRVTTTCADEHWVAAADVEVVPRATRATPGPGFDLAAAVIVVDPGHGFEDGGARGPNGLDEKVVNLDIADRLRTLLQSPRAVDWGTGDVLVGSDYPAVDAVWLTRDPNGPMGGDAETSLAYRALVADAAGADALISIHNNTVPKGERSSPGTEVFFSVGNPGSDRLASLIHEELVRSFSPLMSAWSGKSDAGLRGRVDDGGEDFYGVLRRATQPAVIVEGLYLSEAPEEALLAQGHVRQAYAEGVYRGLVRFLTTDETGSPIPDPVTFSDSPGSPSFSDCDVPTQP
jgi:N-acetylmuramoyl-L-alanine amidase